MTRSLPQAWDEVAATLGTYPFADEHVRYAAAMQPVLGLPRTARILEAGCGAGRLLRALAALGYEQLVGLEISLARLREVSQRGPRAARLVCCDRVPFRSETFDAVVSAAVIEHVTDPRAWLAELARVARPGAAVSIATDTYMWRWLKRLGLYQSDQPLDEAIWPGALVRWAREAGLQLRGCGGFINTPEQRRYLAQQLLHLVPGGGRCRRWLCPERPTNQLPDETAAILQAARGFQNSGAKDPWSCVWSYECYYWFRKC
jgi:SAM-dependent methyltransferase